MPLKHQENIRAPISDERNKWPVTDMLVPPSSVAFHRL